MKFTLLLLVYSIFFTPIAHAQQRGDVETYYDRTWKKCEADKASYVSYVRQTDSGWYRKDYFVYALKAQMVGLYQDEDNKIANGWFRFYYANGMMEQQGQKLKNKKQGLWLRYHHNGMMADSTVYVDDEPVGISKGWHENGYIADSINYEGELNTAVYWFDNGAPAAAGHIKDGERTGPWQFFHKDGAMAAKEKYEMGHLISKQYFDEQGSEDPDTTSKDREAAFKNGEKGWEKFVYKKIYFPHNYKFTDGDEVTVMVTAVIDEDGNVTQPFVELPLHPEFDAIAISIFKESPKWIPAMRHNRRVKMTVSQGITFKQGY